VEEIDCRRIETSDGNHLVQYRDQLMPLLRIDADAGIKQDGVQPILVFSGDGHSMGLVVDEIVDIVAAGNGNRSGRACEARGKDDEDLFDRR
jgi:two-component system, chemotaxis family, sensor kinase CheA